MRLSILLDEINILETKNYNKDINIEGISYHSAYIKDSYLFVAIKGYKTDGHKYIPQAIDKGAIVIIVEKFNKDISLPQIKVKDSRKALAIISSAYYGNPSKSMKIIGITGTNGKTTTTYLLNSILQASGCKTGIIGSIGNKIGGESLPCKLTTPESLDLHEIFYRMKGKETEYVAMEVSSSGLELDRVYGIDFDIVGLSNISREHIDQHGSFSNYWGIKKKLITEVKEGSYAILNLDDEYSKSLLNETRAKVITYGIFNKEGNFYCKDINLYVDRVSFTVVISKAFQGMKSFVNKGEFKVALPIPGLHSIANSLYGISIALILGVDYSHIISGLKNFKGVKRRFETIYKKEFTIIDDHIANGGNMDVCFENIKRMRYNKLHIVYGIRGNRGLTVNRENIENLGKWKRILDIEDIVATTSRGHVSENDRVSQEEINIFEETMKKSNIKYTIIDDLPSAIEKAIQNARKDDIILLAGAQSMEYGGELAIDILDKIKRID